MEPTLPALPIDFGMLTDLAWNLFTTIITQLAPYAVVMAIVYYGIHGLIQAFETPAPTKSWEGHSDGLYNWFKDYKQRHELTDKDVPDWVADREEYDDILGQERETLRRREFRRMAREELQQDNNPFRIGA